MSRPSRAVEYCPWELLSGTALASHLPDARQGGQRCLERIRPGLRQGPHQNHVLDIRVQRAVERGAVLRLHDQRHRDQEHGQHDEDLAEGHFRRAAEGAAHDVDGLVAPGQQGREQAGKGTYHPDQQRIDQQIARGQMHADGHVRIVQQAVDGWRKGIGQ